jgi:hypothetical protein
VADDDYRVEIALLKQTVLNLAAKIADVEARSDKQHEKTNGIIKWVVLLMGSAVFAQVLRTAGIGL